MLLATEKPKRFSIDIDIITEHTEKEIIGVLQKIVDEQNGEIKAYNHDNGAVFEVVLKKFEEDLV